MERLIMYVILIGLALFIFLISGRNKRELKKIPEGMNIFTKNPMMRYIMYALGLFIFVFVGGVGVLCYIMDGVEDAGIWFYICMALGILDPLICFLGGYLMYSSHIFFDDEKLLLGRPFRAPLRLTWYEIGEMKMKDRQSFVLYDRDGKPRVKAYIGMINYDIFLRTAQRHCRPHLAESQQLERGEKENALKYGGEYYVMAVMGLLVFFMTLFLFLSSGESLYSLWTSSELNLFAKIFPIACGVGSIGLLIYCRSRKVVYSTYEIQMHYLLKRTVTIYWKEINAVEFHQKGSGVKKSYIVHLQTSSGKYTLRSGGMRSGWDEFLPFLVEYCLNNEIPITRL